jgi:hypothetical protein
MATSIFFDFNLPNSTTWFYFSLMLVVAIFLRFDRLLTLRNWDLLTLFLLVPGFLLLQEGHILQSHAFPKDPKGETQNFFQVRGDQLVTYGYVWLIVGSGYLFVRCLFDLGLVRRPLLAPNLNLGGLSALAAVLFICMITVAIRRLPDQPIQSIGKQPIAIAQLQEGTTSIVGYNQTDLSKADTRFWVERTVAMVLHFSVLLALVLIGARHFQDTTSGMAAACLYLMIPYTAYHISQVHHVWPSVFILWAIYTYRQPILTGMLLGFAAGSVFFPFLLFPLWVGFYRGRGAGRFTFGFLFAALLSLSATALLLLWKGDFTQHLKIALSLSDWQAWRMPQAESIWTGTHWAYRLPVFIAYMAFVFLTMFWPSERHLGQVIAQTSAVVIGVQFWYGEQGGVYVLWYLPFLLLMIFRPNLTDRRPPIIESETDWVKKTIGRMRKTIRRWFVEPKSVMNPR